MTDDQKLFIWGEGVAFIDGEMVPEVQEVGLDFGINTIQEPKGDGGGNIVVTTGQPITGRINYVGMSPTLFALLTGTANATGTVLRKRPTTIAKVTNSVTIPDATYIAYTLVIIPEGANKSPLKLVASDPAVGEYSVSTTTITLNASQTETNFVLDYLYSNDAVGLTTTFDPSDMPEEFGLYFTLRAKDLFPGTKGDIAFYAAKCNRTSPLNMGASVGEAAKMGFDFNVRIDSSGDLLTYWPNT
jgi:hypothetical protein